MAFLDAIGEAATTPQNDGSLGIGSLKGEIPHE
jgi:hypothetical protein